LDRGTHPWISTGAGNVGTLPDRLSTGPWIRGCKSCGAPGRRFKELSATGLCLECGEAIVRDNVYQLVAHRGPRFEAWRRAMIAAFQPPAIDSTEQAS